MTQASMMAPGTERGGGIRARLTKKGQQITGLIVGVQETGGRLKVERPVVVLKATKGTQEKALQGTEREKGQ